jgi:hypothetical protein
MPHDEQQSRTPLVPPSISEIIVVSVIAALCPALAVVTVNILNLAGWHRELVWGAVYSASIYSALLLYAHRFAKRAKTSRQDHADLIT